MRLVPDDIQQQQIDRMIAEPTRAALLAADTGVGKTLMAVEVAKGIGAKTVLVIAPLGTRGSMRKKDGWIYTFHRQGIDLPWYDINSKYPHHYGMLKAGIPGIYFVGREFFGLSGTDERFNKNKPKPKNKLRKKRWSWAKVKPDLAIFDEVQAASNRNSYTYEALRGLSAGYKIAASATPNGNKFAGMWSVTRWLWKDVHNPAIPYDEDAEYASMYVDNSFWRWAAQWATVEKDQFVKLDNGDSGQKVTGEAKPGAFVSTLPCYIRMEAERTPVEQRVVKVDLTDTQRRMFDEMSTAMLTWLEDHPLVADLPIVQRTRLRQITLAEPRVTHLGVDEEGLPIVEVDFAYDCESSKITALETIISKYHPDEPLLILTDSQKFAAVVTHRLGERAAEYSGRVKHDERERIKHEFGRSIDYLVAVIPAVAEGLDGLQKVCKTEVWLSESLNGMLNLQAEGRLNRRGQEAEQITRYKIQARNTDDDRYFNNLIAQRRANYASMTPKRRTA